jgi:hypothetical protein
MLYCKNCKEMTDQTEFIQRFKDGTDHIRGECNICQNFCGYVPYKYSRTVTFLIDEAYTARMVKIYENTKGEDENDEAYNHI